MAGAKFFIYGGCRWREIDTNTGRVSGWGDVQFLTARRGRLEVARSSSVLRGLRSLAENKPTSVHDGLQLSHKRQWDAIENKKNALDSHHHCCCHQQNFHRNSDANHNKISTNTAAIQCTISNKSVLCEQNNIESRSKSPKHDSEITSSEQDTTSKTDRRLISKRKRSVSDDENRESEIRISKCKKSKNKKRSLDISQDSFERKRSQIQKPIYVVKKRKNGKLLIKKKNLSISSKYKNGNLSERELLRSKRKHSTSEDDSQDVPSKYKSIPNLQYDRNKKLRQSMSNDKRKASSKVDMTLSKNEIRRRDSPRKASSSLNVNRTEDRRNSLKKRKLSKRNISSELTSGQTQKGPCKELFISEDDVMLLRTFIEKDKKNIFDVDLERFDTNDDYKSMVFYALNPLVNVTRCPKISEMLQDERSQCNSVSLKDFISKLGLRSVLDTSSQKRSKYKMRARKSQNETPDKSKSGSETDKENSMAESNRNMKLDKVLVERMKIKKNNRIGDRKKAVGLLGQMTSRPRRKNHQVPVLSSDSDSVFEKSKQPSPVLVKKKPVLAVKSAVRRTGRAGREYSRAEDEAIVAWLRGVGRARRVNGNQLWRELQPLHHQATGQFRSWHSLRNRYLRYVLPALGALAVAPHEAARLRAAAAAGEMKSRKQPQRRNSLILQPRVQSAWSRRPRPPRESTPPTPSPPRDTRSLPPSRPSSSSSASVDSNYSSHSVVDSGKETSPERTPPKRVNTRSSIVKSVAKESTTRTLRSSAAGVSPIRVNTRADIHVPTYSELTQRFASKHKDDTDSDAFETVNTDTTDRQFTKRLRSSRQMDSTGRNSAGTDRHSAGNERPRTRRLYNPNAI